MQFINYLRDCLKDPDFKYYWELDSSELNLDENLNPRNIEELSAFEALKLLEQYDLDSIITNKGIHPSIETQLKSEIIFFEDGGKCPVKDFLEEISDKKLKSKTLYNIARLAMEGRNARPPLSSYVDEGIFELRSKQSSNIDRIFYFFVFGDLIVLTNGYIKKSQKLDEQEFERAKRYRDIYMKNFK